MKTALKIVLAGMLAAASLGVAGARASDAYDGSWRVTVVGESGSCASQTLSLEVVDGTVSFVSLGGRSFAGTVARNGRLNVRLAFFNDAVIVSGGLHSGAGRGSWNFASLHCAGSWSAQREQGANLSASLPTPTQ